MLEFYYPFKPFYTTQKWGEENPTYKENGFPFSRHNGVDANVGRNNRDSDKFLVYCPIANLRVHSVKWRPNGAGHGIYLISKDKVMMDGMYCYAYLVLFHAHKILVPAGYEPKLGELIMIADNTGFSTGPHTHIGLYRVDYDGKALTFLDRNDADNSIDPFKFLTNEYAVDKADVATLVKSGLRYYSYLLSG